MMRFSLVVFSFLSLSVFAQSKKRTVLFLGNSYTYVNNLPQLIANIALAGGDTLDFDSNCPGGYTFNNHFTDAQSLAKINLKPWHYVVLQAQSQEPSFSPQQVAAQTLPFAIKLDSLVKTNYACGTTVFYETWGRKTGDASNCAAYPPVCTYTGMQNRLKQSYKLFADTTGALMAPAGEAFRNSIAANPALELYQSDQSHPVLEGSYLAACVFYELLFQKSVLSNTYNPGIASGTLTFLQQIAHTKFRDSLAVWNIGKNSPWAAFTSSTSGANSVQFSPVSLSLNHSWYFGDGNNSSLANPTHQYANAGNYTVSHVSYNACKKDSASAIVSVSGGVNGLSTLNKPDQVRIYPNPCNTELKLMPGLPVNEGISSVSIYDIGGNLVYHSAFSFTINTAALKPGIYFLKLNNNSRSLNARFIKVDD